MEAEKHYGEALKIREDLAQLHQDHRVWSPELLLLQVARCHAVCASAAPPKQDHTSKALEALQALAALDFRDPVLLRTDHDLAALQKEPAFLSLLEKLR
jgi:hypothetical protein